MPRAAVTWCPRGAWKRAESHGRGLLGPAAATQQLAPSETHGMNGEEVVGDDGSGVLFQKLDASLEVPGHTLAESAAARTASDSVQNSRASWLRVAAVALPSLGSVCVPPWTAASKKTAGCEPDAQAPPTCRLHPKVATDWGAGPWGHRTPGTPGAQQPVGTSRPHLRMRAASPGHSAARHRVPDEIGWPHRQLGPMGCLVSH